MIVIKKIKITTQREYTNRNMRRDERRRRRALDRSPVLLLFFVTGLVGVLFGIGDNVTVENQMYIYMTMFLSVLSVFLWYFYFFHTRIFAVISIIMSLATVVIFVPEVWSVTRQAFSGEVLNLSAPLIISGLILVVFVLFSFEFILRSHWLVLFVSFGLIVFAPVMNLKFGYITVILGVIFNIAFVIVNMTESRSGRDTFRMNDRSKISVASTLITIAVIIVTIVPAFPIENIVEKELFASTGKATEIISDTAVALAESVTANLAPEGITAEGKIHLSELTYTGNTLMTVKVDKVPKTTIYMHGFQGGKYENGAWKSAFIEPPESDVNKDRGVYQEPFMMDVIKSINGDYSTIMKNTSDPISDIYYNYSMMNDASKEKFHADMTEMNETYSTVCTPYYSQYSEGRIRVNHRIGENGYSNNFAYAEGVNMKNYWKYNIQVEMLVDAYIKRIGEEYTKYPENSNASLKELCEKTPLEHLDDITTFIVCTLQNKAEFTKKTGVVPFDRDAVDYFLFGSGKGDSIYFASAATLMYQMYGIPARYVSGFIVKPDDFEKSESGFIANITDGHSYSWTEIFLKDYGWVPVDVTPDESGKLFTEYPGYNADKMKKIMSENNWTFRDRAAEKLEEENRISEMDYTPVTVTLIIGVIAVIGGGVLFIFLKRKKTVSQKPNTVDCRVIFDRLIRAIHFENMLMEYNGSESDFYIRLSESFPDVSEEDAEKMFEILCEDSFSPDSEANSEKNREFIEAIYQKVSSRIYSKMKWYRKPVFKYIKNLV